MKKNLPSSAQLPFLTGIAILLFEIAAVTSSAQITITSADMPVAGNVYFMAEDTNVAVTGAAGASQQWDFSGWQNHGIDTNYFADPSTLAGYSSFPSSNLGVTDGASNIFLNNSSSSLDILGFYTDFGSGPAALPFTPAQKFISFPSNYQTAYNGTSRYELAIAYPQPPVDSVKIISNISYSSEMDAWGTLTTPSYSGISCLRQKYTEIKTDSTFLYMFGSWSPSGAPTIDTTITYRWWSNSEEFPVAEIQTDGSGNVTSANYLTSPPPQAQISFTATPTSGCAPMEVTFTNTSSGAVYYQWYFGDGNSYTGVDTSHIYTAGGNYWVVLAAYDGNFNYLGDFYTVIYVGGSAGYFEMTADSACPGDMVNFKGQDALDYAWNFGDGATASGDQYVSHAYAAPGTYSVSLIVTTACGDDTIVQDIAVGANVTPDNGFYMWPTEICPGQPVNLYSYPVGNNYQWNFGDGTSGSGQSTTHSYPNTGNYTITCIVTNSCGNSSTSTSSISVVPNAQFPSDIGVYHWPQPACPGTEVFFNAPSDMESYIWNFGDGSPADTSSDNEVPHDFSTAGTYTVSVTITNYCGNDTTLSATVVIGNNVPFNGWFDMNIMPSPACPGSTVSFQAWSNDAVSYSWDFGDGASSGYQSASHIYPNAGMYNASLTMANSCGNDTTIIFAVNINNNVFPDPDNYDYGVATDTACSGDSVLFYIAPAGSGSYLWNFGDGTSDTTSYLFTDGGSSVDIAPHVFSGNGIFNVTFTLTNQCGNSFTDTFSVTIGSNVQVDGDLWVNGEEFCQGDTVKFNALGGASYVWNFGDGSPGLTTAGVITEAFHSYSFSGDYPVSVNITNSCGNSAVYNDIITIDSCNVSVQDISAADGAQLYVYPNPGNGKFRILAADAELKAGKITVYNVPGEIVYSASALPLSAEIDLSAQPGGIYFILLHAGEKTYYSKLIIE